MQKKPNSNIFCLEGEWESDLTKELSVKPLLDFFSTCLDSKHIYRRIATYDELCYYLKRFGRHSTYGILYLAFHGASNKLMLSDRELNLQDLRQELSGKLNGKVILFGSCSVLKIGVKKISDFKAITGANAIVGYSKNIEFFDSSLIDLKILNFCQFYRTSDSLRRNLEKHQPFLIEKLGLKVF
jgi:hypothetical protein